MNSYQEYIHFGDQFSFAATPVTPAVEADTRLRDQLKVLDAGDHRDRGVDSLP